MLAEKRKYPRIATRIQVKWRCDPVEQPTADYTENVAKNISLGGMFVATDEPLPEGSLVTLLFSTVPEESPVTVNAIVRWRRRWLSPRGMGLAFYEFEGLAGREREAWMGKALRKATAVQALP